MQTTQVYSNIVPWVLPREDIPFSVRWNGKLDFDTIVVEVSEDMEIKELVNVGGYELKGNSARISEIKEAPNSPLYFGGVVATKGITTELKESRELKVRFLNEGQIVHEEVLEARIFRPLLEIISYPEKVTLKEQRAIVPLNMRYVGFGDINIRILGYIGGRIVTRGKSLVYDLMKRMIKEGIESDDSMKSELRDRAYVSPDSVRQITQEILQLLKKPAGDPEISEVVDQMRELFADERLKQKMEEVVYSKVEDMMLSMIIDLYERRPVSNVKLAYGQTTIEALLSAPLEILTLVIQYSDILGNHYPELKVEIQIETKIEAGQELEVQIPIQVQNWQHEPFLNVSEMKI